MTRSSPQKSRLGQSNNYRRLLFESHLIYDILSLTFLSRATALCYFRIWLNFLKITLSIFTQKAVRVFSTSSSSYVCPHLSMGWMKTLLWRKYYCEGSKRKHQKNCHLSRWVESFHSVLPLTHRHRLSCSRAHVWDFHEKFSFHVDSDCRRYFGVGKTKTLKCPRLQVFTRNSILANKARNIKKHKKDSKISRENIFLKFHDLSVTKNRIHSRWRCQIQWC